jgi:hypothetical protein
MFFPDDAIRGAAQSELVGWAAVEAYARDSSTLAGQIPLGTVVTGSVRYFMVSPFALHLVTSCKYTSKPGFTTHHMIICLSCSL